MRYTVQKKRLSTAVTPNCTKSFKREENLNLHIRVVHTGESAKVLQSLLEVLSDSNIIQSPFKKQPMLSKGHGRDSRRGTCTDPEGA